MESVNKISMRKIKMRYQELSDVCASPELYTTSKQSLVVGLRQ